MLAAGSGRRRQRATVAASREPRAPAPRRSMFQPAPKRCFTIESLVAKDSPLPASRSEDPIRPAALSYANSSPINPFLNGFHSAAAAAAGRGVYSNPDLVFAEAVSHPPNPAVPVHPVPPPHALAAHPLPSSHSPHPLFASQQRDPSTFYPWLIHRYRYLGHRFQGTCHVAGLPRAASRTAWACSGWAPGKARVEVPPAGGPRALVGNWAARGRARCGSPAPKAAARFGTGLRPPVVPSPLGSRQAAREPQTPRGAQAPRLLGDALATWAPRGEDWAPSTALYPVRHRLRVPSAQTRDFSVSDFLGAARGPARPGQNQGVCFFPRAPRAKSRDLCVYFSAFWRPRRGGNPRGLKPPMLSPFHPGAERPRREGRFRLGFVCLFIYLFFF